MVEVQLHTQYKGVLSANMPLAVMTTPFMAMMAVVIVVTADITRMADSNINHGNPT